MLIYPQKVPAQWQVLPKSRHFGGWDIFKNLWCREEVDITAPSILPQKYSCPVPVPYRLRKKFPPLSNPGRMVPGPSRSRQSKAHAHADVCCSLCFDTSTWSYRRKHMTDGPMTNSRPHRAFTQGTKSSNNK